jgi:hypothetical protein
MATSKALSGIRKKIGRGARSTRWYETQESNRCYPAWTACLCFIPLQLELRYKEILPHFGVPEMLAMGGVYV